MKHRNVVQTGLLTLIFVVAFFTFNKSQAKPRETRNFADFSQIRLNCSADIFLTQATELKVEVEGEADQLDYLKTKTSGNTLEIDIEGWNLRLNPMKVYIAIPTLEKIMLNGSGDIKTTNTIQAKSLEMALAGSGDIYVTLKAQDLKVSVNGSGDIHASGVNNSCDIKINGSGDVILNDIFVGLFGARIYGSGDLRVNGSANKIDIQQSASGDVYLTGLPAKEAAIRISGSGNVSAAVSDKLEVNINGSGDVKVKGNPQYKNVDIKGSGRVSYE